MAENYSALLDTMSLVDLNELIASATAVRARKAKDEQKTLQKEFEQRLTEMGMSTKDFFGKGFKGAKRGPKASPKKKQQRRSKRAA